MPPKMSRIIWQPQEHQPAVNSRPYRPPMVRVKPHVVFRLPQLPSLKSFYNFALCFELIFLTTAYIPLASLFSIKFVSTYRKPRTPVLKRLQTLDTRSRALASRNMLFKWPSPDFDMSFDIFVHGFHVCVGRLIAGLWRADLKISTSRTKIWRCSSPWL